jgi:trans-aconitate methyltransferase
MPPSPLTAHCEAVARIGAAYDAIPYDSLPYVRLQPARMAAAALWFGLTAPFVQTARVLEIGCASGGHLIPLAAASPGASFLGVDLSPVQIAAGEARIARMGLANIALRACSFDEIGTTDCAFDFIVCHGVYSWIPEPMREDLLRVISERLAPDGAAAVSFNVLPGWRLFQILRDSLLLHARLQKDPAARATRARELIATLSVKSNNKYSYGRFWRDEAQRMSAGGDAYIAHEFFEDDNAPSTFSDFSDALDRHRLAYLSESVVAANWEDGMAGAGGATIRALSRGDDRAREQYIDIFTGRVFREALIVHAGRAGAIRRGILREQLEVLHLVAPSTLTLRPRTEAQNGWRAGNGEGGIVVEDEAVAEAIRRLIARLPGSSRLEDVAPVASTEPALRVRIGDALGLLVAFGHCAISTEPVHCATRLAERPIASRLAASDALVADATASLWHEPIRLEPLQRLYLTLLDGTRTRDDLFAHALDLAERGELQISGPGGRVEGRDNLAAALAPATDRCLESLLRLGLLEDD